MKKTALLCRGTYRWRLVSAILCGMLIICFVGCSKNSPENDKITESEVVQAIKDYIAPQVSEYKKAFNVDDFSVDVQIKDIDIIGDKYVSCTIRDIIVSPTLSANLRNGTFTDEMLRQLSAISFEYEKFKHKNYEIDAFSCFVGCPKFRDELGNEYTVSETILLKGDIIAYISPNATLAYPAKVGDNINDVVNEDVIGAKSASSGNKCPNCNGSGYVKYYYGDSNLQAYFDGYDPYTIGKCPSCHGTGR